MTPSMSVIFPLQLDRDIAYYLMVSVEMTRIKEYTMQVSEEFEECRKQAFALALRLLGNKDDALEVVQSSIEKGMISMIMFQKSSKSLS